MPDPIPTLARLVAWPTVSDRSLVDLAAELGVHQRTLYRWIEEAPPRVPLAPVVVVEGEHERRTAPVVVLPGGARIEGLDLAALAELVRRLG